MSEKQPITLFRSNDYLKFFNTVNDINKELKTDNQPAFSAILDDYANRFLPARSPAVMQLTAEQSDILRTCILAAYTHLAQSGTLDDFFSEQYRVRFKDK